MRMDGGAGEIHEQTPLFLIYEEWLWWSYIDREFDQVGGMHEFDVASPSLQNNVAIVGTSDMTSEAQIELTRLFESYK